jgi:hypothetical protein
MFGFSQPGESGGGAFITAPHTFAKKQYAFFVFFKMLKERIIGKFFTRN